MKLEERIEAIEKVLDGLASLPRDVLVVVEGRRDVEALRSLGVECDVRALNEGEPLVNFTDSIVGRHPKVVLLTDWDRKGGHLARLLLDLFGARIPVDAEPRRLLARWCAVKAVEELPSYLANLRLKAESGLGARPRDWSAPPR